jgi:hypothetical protein
MDIPTRLTRPDEHLCDLRSLNGHEVFGVVPRGQLAKDGVHRRDECAWREDDKEVHDDEDGDAVEIVAVHKAEDDANGVT